MSSGTFLINQGRTGMGMLLPQRASSMNNVYRTQKVPFVNMVHVEEKIGLPPVKALRVKYKDLNNNVMVGNVLRPRKDDRPHEKYCSLTVDKQFWRKNINPLLELKREGWDKSGNRFIDKFNNSKYKFCNEIVKNKNKEVISNNSNAVDVVKEDKEEIKKLLSSNNVIEKSNEGGNGNECEMNSNNNNNDLDKSKDLLEEGEIHNIVNYMSGLDYDKYSKDMELKEALHLLKHKMEKQAAEEMKDNNNITNDNNNLVTSNAKQEEHIDEHETPTIDEPPKHETPPKPIINEEEEKKQEEIDKYKMVEQISKNKTLRKVHSYKSIQKLLDREGLNDVKLLDTTKFTKANHITFKLPPLCSKDKPTTFNEHS
jgi:hypothetical protein